MRPIMAAYVIVGLVAAGASVLLLYLTDDSLASTAMGYLAAMVFGVPFLWIFRRVMERRIERRIAARALSAEQDPASPAGQRD